ncbi:MAG: hypothetical protein PHG06_15795 [Parabacteroides sp.]|jgi:hypothetical protein|nr:hypothetical protein [Parabacteroides sp.]
MVGNENGFDYNLSILRIISKESLPLFHGAMIADNQNGSLNNPDLCY